MHGSHYYSIQITDCNFFFCICKRYHVLRKFIFFDISHAYALLAMRTSTASNFLKIFLCPSYCAKILSEELVAYSSMKNHCYAPLEHLNT